MGTVVDDSLDYAKYSFTHRTYQLTKITQQTGLQTITIPVVGGIDSIFELLPKVYNLSKSYIFGTITMPEAPENNYNWMYADGITLSRQIQLYTRSGLYLADVNDACNYTNMVLRRETRDVDMLNYDKVVQNAGTFNNIYEGLYPSNSAANINYRPTANGLTSVTNYMEPGYCLVGGEETATPIINFTINLDKIKNTLLEHNKDIYFNGEILYLRIVWALSTKIFFNSTSNTAPATGVAAANAVVTITNLLFYLAVEVNPEIENMIKAKCASSEELQILTPYIYYSKLNLPSASTQNLTVRYNRAHGIKLLKIFWAAYNVNETSNTAYDHDCKANAKVRTFYTMINNIRTTQYDYITSNYDDYMVKKEKLRGSSIFSSDEYYYNWVWVEDFTENNPVWKSTSSSVPKQNCIDGLDLTNEIKYDIYSTTASLAFNHYIYAVTQKLLTISPTGINLL